MQGLSEFKLKKFKIMQSDKGMKVSLDALIFAAYIEKDKKTAIDIGAGTGVLSLVLAQDSKTHITALEIDSFISDICEMNFKASPFASRLDLKQTCFLDYMKTEGRPSFDLVISNPPFFKDSIQSKEEKRNIARHETNFSYKDIIHNAGSLLNDEGFLYLLMPYSRCDEIRSCAKRAGLYLCELALIKSRSNKAAKTAIYRFSNLSLIHI